MAPREPKILRLSKELGELGHIVSFLLGKQNYKQIKEGIDTLQENEII